MIGRKTAVCVVVSPPCPPWCTIGDGHGYDTSSGSGNPWRIHSRRLAAGITLVQHESATADGPHLYGYEVLTSGSKLATPGQVRAFAARLSACADDMEALISGAPAPRREPRRAWWRD